MARDQATIVDEDAGAAGFGEYAVTTCTTRFVHAPSAAAAKDCAASAAVTAKNHTIFIITIPPAQINRTLYATINSARAALKSCEPDWQRTQRLRAARELARCAMALIREADATRDGEVRDAAQRAFQAAKAFAKAEDIPA